MPISVFLIHSFDYRCLIFMLISHAWIILSSLCLFYLHFKMIITLTLIYLFRCPFHRCFTLHLILLYYYFYSCQTPNLLHLHDDGKPLLVLIAINDLNDIIVVKQWHHIQFLWKFILQQDVIVTQELGGILVPRILIDDPSNYASRASEK